MAGNRCRADEFADRVNAAVELVDAGVPVVDAARVLVDRFGCSPRQARRYLARAAAGGGVSAPEPTVAVTAKVPATLAGRVRDRAHASGGTVSAVVAAALAEHLAEGRARPGGR
jgi:hypothetical protein